MPSKDDNKERLLTEVSGLKKLDTPPSIPQLIDRHLKERSKRGISNFTKKSKKTAGVVAGYTAEDEYKAVHMIKSTTKHSNIFKQIFSWWDKICPVHEFVTSELYRLLALYDRTSTVELTRDNKNSPLYLRRKFLSNFTTLDIFSGAPEGSKSLKRGKKELKKLKGLAKVLISGIMYGEYDLHSGNIGVIEQKVEKQDITETEFI